MTTTHFHTCPLCEATCGLELTLDPDSRSVVSIRGDAEDVFSRGFICPKGAALGALHADPDRLRQPLVRRDGALQPASWDQAFARVAAGLGEVRRAHGDDAVAVYLGNPNVHNLASSLYVRPLIKALKTKQRYSASSVDQLPKHVSAGVMFGHPMTIPIPDVDRTDLLVILGANPWVSNGSLCTAPDFPGRLRALRDRGGRLVVVDPRRTETAKRADAHLPIRPGSDALLLFALIHVLFDEGRVDLGPLAAFTDGVDAVRELARPFSPAAVAAACGLPVQAITQLARDLAAAERATIHGRMGTCTQRFGTLSSWLVDVVHVLLGQLDRPGGAMFPRPAHERHRPGREPGGRGFAIGRWHSRVAGHAEAIGELPVATLADEILTPGDGQVRALLTVAGNPARSTPGSDRMETALGALDFMVCVDIYLNETTRFADVVLPPASTLERPHFDIAFYGLAVRNIANYSPAAFALTEGALDEAAILLRLTAIAAGQGADADLDQVDDFIFGMALNAELRAANSPIAGRTAPEILAALAPRRRVERLVDFLVRSGPYGDHFGAAPDGLTLDALLAAPHGVDLGPLNPRLPELLKTPTGRIDLAPAAIVADVPRLQRVLAEDGDGDGLVLIGRRTLRSNNSWMHNLPPLVSGRPRCTLEIHPDDAARLGLADGAVAVVRSAVGSVTAPVKVTDAVRAGVVSLPHGWGHGAAGAQLGIAADHAGVNANALTDPADLDAISGNAVLNGVPVQVSAAS